MSEQKDKHKEAFRAAGGRVTKQIKKEVKRDARDETTGIKAQLGLKAAIEEIGAVNERVESADQRKIMRSATGI